MFNILKQRHEILPTLTALLSSSCCIIQLVLNFFSVSCAGFAVFTPYRRILTTITILLLSYNLYNKGLNNRQMIFSVIFSIALMISPEITSAINQQQKLTTTTTTTGSSITYRIHLDGLGCEACANRIKNTLNSVEWISNTQVYFNNQTAIVQANTMNPNAIVDLIKSIDMKYDAQVLDSWVGYTK